MAYKSKYLPTNKEKYIGDWNKIRCLSNWERIFCRYLDNNPMVLKWCSEDVHVDYLLECDGTKHYYMIDFYVIMSDGKKLLIEIKPLRQTIPPKKPKKITKRYLAECFAYNKNISKWKAAKKFAESNGAEFLIFTEIQLKQLGLKIL